eukprot:7021205-Pyramimonas_sp.AAC.1
MLKPERTEKLRAHALGRLENTHGRARRLPRRNDLFALAAVEPAPHRAGRLAERAEAWRDIT